MYVCVYVGSLLSGIGALQNSTLEFSPWCRCCNASTFYPVSSFLCYAMLLRLRLPRLGDQLPLWFLLLGRQVLRDYSPQGLTRGSSVKVPDKRLATVAFLILIHTELGKVISAIFKALGMPHSFAACLSFLFCELRKYFGTNVKKYRPGFQDKSKRDEFVALLSEFGEDVGSWLTNAGEDCFITWSDDDDDVWESRNDWFAVFYILPNDTIRVSFIFLYVLIIDGRNKMCSL